MYDKYSIVNTITVGAILPKHKGMLFANSNTTVSGVTLTFLNFGGATFNTLIQVAPSGSSLLPITAYSVPTALPSGVTAFYVA